MYNLDIRFQLSPDKKMLVLSNTTSSMQGTKACKDREVPTLQQKREREEAKVKAEGKAGEKVTYRREWTSGQGGKPEL